MTRIIRNILPGLILDPMLYQLPPGSISRTQVKYVVYIYLTYLMHTLRQYAKQTVSELVSEISRGWEERKKHICNWSLVYTFLTTLCTDYIFFIGTGQYGAFGFSVTAFVGFIIASIMSIMDSIGDYYACARVCRVPPPPAHGVNRGIAIEGLCSALSGAIGCGHATSTYGGNIGAIGITRVRHSVLIICCICYFIV